MKKILLAAAAAAAVTLAGCTPTGTQTAEQVPVSTPVPVTTDIPAGFESYYTQEVQFEPCEVETIAGGWTQTPKELGRYHCATLSAPLNWDDPAAEPIELSVAWYAPHPDEQDRRLLFFNLGGPGGEAVESLVAFNEAILPPEIFEVYDTIAVDPRGVGGSTPVDCWTSAERDELFAESGPDWQELTLDETVAELTDQVKKDGEACLEKNGDILGYVDTDSAARDFDLVRALFGQEQMDYLGFSYGTFLGAVYADLFPSHVGRFVLDAPVDPSVDTNEMSALQAQGMEESLYHWIETCQEQPDCPLTGGLEDGKQQMIDFFAAVRENPLPTVDGRLLTENLAVTGVVGSLYSTDSYALLTEGMAQAFDGDGTILLTLSDQYNGRKEDGSYSNSQDAFVAINALDYEPAGTPEEWLAQAQQLAADYPVLGAGFGFASAGAEAWPVQSRVTRGPIVGEEAPEILIIGATHDPSTPYVMAEAMAKAFDKGVLLTRDGWGHGSYDQAATQCIQDAVTPFLLEGIVPADGLVCVD